MFDQVAPDEASGPGDQYSAGHLCRRRYGRIAAVAISWVISSIGPSTSTRVKHTVGGVEHGKGGGARRVAVHHAEAHESLSPMLQLGSYVDQYGRAPERIEHLYLVYLEAVILSGRLHQCRSGGLGLGRGLQSLDVGARAHGRSDVGA